MANQVNSTSILEDRENAIPSIQILQAVTVTGLVIWVIYLFLELSSLSEVKSICRKRVTDISPRRISHAFGQDENQRSHWHLKGLLLANTIANLLFISIVGVLAFNIPFKPVEACDYLGRAIVPLYAMTSQTSLLFCKKSLITYNATKLTE